MPETGKTRRKQKSGNMKKQIFMAAVFMAAIGITGRLCAQQTAAEVAKTRTKSNNTNEKPSNTGTGACVVKVSSSATCAILFLIMPLYLPGMLQAGRHRVKECTSLTVLQ